jgi:hypothetical protein
MQRIAALLGVLGGGVAVASLLAGFAVVGADPLYQPRWGFGAAALVLGIIGGISGFVPRLHPAAAGVLMFVAGTLGFLTTLVWYLNTWYLAALPLWLLGAVLLLIAALGRYPGQQRVGSQPETVAGRG